MSDPTTDPTDDTEEVTNPEGQERSREAARYRTERNTAREQLKTARLETAVHRANSALPEPFVDADVALRLLDPADLRYDADGKPQGVAEALERLAEDYPALLRNTGEPKPTQSSAGLTGNGTRDKGASNFDTAALKKKFPALNRGPARSK